MGRGLLKVGGVVAIVLIAIPGVVIASHWGDPAIDDSDLRVERLELSPEENGFELLHRTAADSWWPDEQSSELAALLRAEAWDPALAEEALGRNQALLSAIPAVLAASHFQAPEFELDDPDAGLEALGWTIPARLLSIRAQQHARAGRTEAAFQDALAAVRLGRRVQAARGGSLLSTMMGTSMKRVGLAAVRGILGFAEIDSRTARRWTEALAPLSCDADAWRRMWAVEYRQMAAVVEQVAEGRVGEQFGGSSTAIVGNSYLFKPNATKALFADFYRGVQRGTAGTCKQARLPELDPPSEAMAKLRAFLGPNGVGKILFRVASPNLVSFQMRRCASDADLEATRAQVALRAWERERGALPTHLQTLVPELLAAVPVDAFDGAPLRYDAEARRLWSVGSDFVDAGGRTPPDDSLDLEPSWRLVF